MRLDILVTALCIASGAASAQTMPSECRAMVQAIGLPVVGGSPADSTLLCRDGYMLLHSSERKTPYWVVERLTPKRFVGPGDRKAQGDPFQSDPDLQNQNIPHATPNDYAGKKSTVGKRSFDRGHMAPAADMKFSENATLQSFYMSNMAPQQGINLNRHIWADLEARVRDWACDRGDVYALTGPIYDDETFDTLGPNEVAVPTAFFKIVYEPRQKRAIGFILPNDKVPRKGRSLDDVLSEYLVPIRDVEQRAGLRLFATLDTRDRNRLRRVASSGVWPVVTGCSAGNG
jgi:endonuclease G